MSKEGKQPGPGKRQVFEFRVKEPIVVQRGEGARKPDTEPTLVELWQETEAKKVAERAEREATMTAAVTSHKPGEIKDAWAKLRESNHTGNIPRASLRRIDMHLALTDPVVIEHVARSSPTTRDLVDTLDRFTGRHVGEGETAPEVAPFSGLRFLGEMHGKELVETGANNRTRKEHARARLGVEVALLATRMQDFLHVLDKQIGPALGEKLTTLERALINDHLTALLEGGEWTRPTPEQAKLFAAWETILGNSRNAHTLNIISEPADFKPEQPASAPSAKRKIPTPWQNVLNAPGDAMREFRKLLPGDDDKKR